MKSTKLLSLPPYLFEELERKFGEASASGRDIINLSVGDPDLDPPGKLKERLCNALVNKIHDRYPPQRGRPELKEAIRRLFARNYGLEPDDEEILILAGSKEGIAHLPLAVCEPGDKVLITDPGYPVYNSAALFAGCKPVFMPINDENGFIPRVEEIYSAAAGTARVIFLNYPNNPTSAAAGKEFFQKMVDFSRQNDTLVANDAAYADIYFDSKPGLLSSISEARKAKTIEFFSFSKMFSITGWRIGFAVGNAGVIESLGHLKANIDSGVFGAVQEALAGTLMNDYEGYLASARETFRDRRDKIAAMMQKLGFSFNLPSATFYLWAKVPARWTSMDFALMLLDRADVLVTPGSGFGAGGEGYFRLALTCAVDRLDEAGERLRGAMESF